MSLPSDVEAPHQDQDRIYPCRECPTMRTKAEGGTVFTVCDECWDRLHPKKTAEIKIAP